MTLFGKYMFTFVFDQSDFSDHISDLIWEVLWSGSIPIHVGATNIQDHIPGHSAILAGTLFVNRKDKLGPYLQKVATDPNLWKTYHAWRNGGDNNSTAWRMWRDKFQFLQTSSYCRMCNWAYAKQYGFGWDHGTQELRPESSILDRHVCIAQNNLLTGTDLQEWWLTSAEHLGPKGKTQHCQLSTPSTATIKLDTHSVTRTVVTHDGTLDVLIHTTTSRPNSGSLILRLELGGGKKKKLYNPEAAHFPNVHALLQNHSSHVPVFSSVAIQDHQSKVTVLANWPTSIYATAPGQVDVLVQANGKDVMLPGETRRVRILMENVDPLRDVPTEYAFSPFASQLARDFLDPLELYYQDDETL